jgi:hypothetical protein
MPLVAFAAQAFGGYVAVSVLSGGLQELVHIVGYRSIELFVPVNFQEGPFPKLRQVFPLITVYPVRPVFKGFPQFPPRLRFTIPVPEAVGKNGVFQQPRRLSLLNGNGDFSFGPVS